MSDGAGQLTPLKRAYLALERLQAEVRRLRERERTPIAVVGVGCRLPGGVVDRESFRELLLAGRDAVSDRPPLPRRGWPETSSSAPFPHPPAGWLDIDPAGFDPGFFGISPREAAGIDPQQRLLLEVAWEALEDAGIAPSSLAGARAGVFVGMAGDDYAQLHFRSPRLDHLLDSHFASGVGQSMASGRVAYLLGLEGPAITLDTACSSSLVAVHLACASLRSGETDLALAGGVNLILSDAFTRAFRRSRMLSDDGRCRAFAEGAAGFGRGEGAGVVVLRRLDDAVEAGDPVLAVIRGSATNQDGASTGLTAPNGRAQAAVIRAALEQAGVTPAGIDAIEAHGTGTELGDPIELRALSEVFAGEEREHPVVIGSVKTNMGHLEAAAGITGLIKAVLALEAGVVPPHLHAAHPTSHVRWDAVPLAIAHEATPFPDVARPRRIGVSSFGFSGTNVHVVLESATPRDAAAPEDRASEGGALLLPLSAASPGALATLAERWTDHLASLAPADLAEACRTAQVGRAPLAHRVAVVGADAAQLRAGLEAFRAGERLVGVHAGRTPPGGPPALAWFCTGQGAQYPGMIEGVAERIPAVREVLGRLGDAFREALDVPLADLLAPGEQFRELLDRTDHTQPALFAVEVALMTFWQHHGVEPEVVVGHSIGEYAAAWYAGVFDLETAARLVAARGRRMQAESEAGGMLAVMAPEQVVAERIGPDDPDLAIAAVNAPNQTVVSGRSDAVAAVEAWADESGIRTRRLRTSHAFHSPLMAGAARDFARDFEGIELRPARRVRLVSTVTGDAVEPETLARPDYWVEQILAPVRFHAAATEAARRVDLAVEVGPHPALAALVREAGLELPVVPTLRRDHAPWPTALAAVGAVFAHGVNPVWPDVGGRRRRIPLTPFERVPLWSELGSAAPTVAAHPLLGAPVTDEPDPTWEAVLDRDTPPFIGEHVVRGRAILPGAAFLEMMQSAARRVGDEAGDGGESTASRRGLRLGSIGLRAPLDLTAGPRRVRTRVLAEEKRVEVRSQPLPGGEGADDHGGRGSDEEWVTHAVAALVDPAVGPAAPAPLDDELTARDVEEYRRALAARGYDLGPRFGGLRTLEVGEGSARAGIVLPEVARADGGTYGFHPLVVDAALQAVGPVLGPTGPERTLVPVAIDRLDVEGATDFVEATVRIILLSRSAGGVVADLIVEGEGGRITLGGVLFRPLDAQLADGFLHHVQWVEAPLSAGAATLDRPTARAVARAVGEALVGGAQEEAVRDYDRVIGHLEARAFEHVTTALDRLGFAPEPGSELTLDGVIDALGVVAPQRRLLARLLDILVSHGALEASGGGWRVPERGWTPEAVSASDPDAAAALAPSPEAQLLERCGPRLGEVLQGADVDPLELLFPGGDVTLASAMYHDAPFARLFNGAVTEAVVRAAEAAPRGRPFRLLEVGGGTGGTTRPVLEALRRLAPDREVEVVFTDISPLFVGRAEAAYGHTPGFEARVFDLDRDPEGEAWTRPFDVVVAANCLHAARDLPAALGRLRGLLREGGLLLAPEVFAPHAWFDLTVGLTGGWWHFDDDVRKDYPCIDAGEWMTVLERAGFHPLQVAPLATLAPELHGVASEGQGVVVATAAPAARSWVVLADRGGTAEAVVERWTSAGHHVGVIPPDGDVRALAEGLRAGGRVDVVSFRALDGARDPVEGVLELVEIIRTVTRSGHAGAPTTASTALAGGTDTSAPVGAVHLVTRGGCLADPADAVSDPAAAALWGTLRTAALEHPEVGWYALDLDPGAGVRERPGEIRAVEAWLAAPGHERERAMRRGAGRVPRWAPGIGAAPAPAGEYRLAPPRAGGIEGLSFHTGERQAPGPGEVEIRVIASALNFKDVLNVAGLYPGDPGPLGSECAGVVTRVGPGVTRVAVGDRVVAAAGHGYGRHLVASSTLVAPLPPTMSFADGAAIPIAYLTAWLGLVELADLGAGDRVLIHAAAGGVGSAACAIARAVGAEILATAGSPEKRARLRAEGIEHVFDSRSDAFVEGVRAATDGEGVDVVLNSLADDLVDATFACIARGGRFVELGKRGIRTPAEVDALGRDLDYHLVDWGETHRRDPEGIGDVFDRVMAAVATGDLPPLPLRRFPLHAVRDAFRVMARGEHVGKLVLEHPLHGPGEPVRFRRDGVYLVTGGTGGLGLRTARWMAGEGAGTVVLVGRKAPTPAVEAQVEALRAEGTEVEVVLCDIGVAGDVERLVARLHDLGPLRGVVHGAGALRDRTLAALGRDEVEAVFRSKVRGSTLIERATRTPERDFFVAYSSIAGVLGARGQANHAAANAWLDAFVGGLRAEGATACSIAWGPWGDSGAAARADVLERARGEGLEPLDDVAGVSTLAAILEAPPSGVIATHLARPEVLAGRGHARLLSERVRVRSAAAHRTPSAPTASEPEERAVGGLVARIAAAPARVRRDHLRRHLVERVRSVLGLPSGSGIEGRRPLGELGLDSLLAVELRNVLAGDLERTLSSTLLFDHPTVDDLTDHLIALLDLAPPPSPAEDDEVTLPPVPSPAPVASSAGEAVGAVEALSDDEVARRLAERLRRR